MIYHMWGCKECPTQEECINYNMNDDNECVGFSAFSEINIDEQPEDF